jgi:hypothetical protein
MIMDKEKEKEYKNNLRGIMRSLAAKNPNLQPQEGTINNVFKVYNRYETTMLGLMKEDGNKDEDESLDRHKIAAALCCAVLKVKPIKLAPNCTNPSSEDKLANGQCAFMLGMQVIQDCWSAKKDESTHDWEKKIYSQKIRLPEPNDEYSEIFARLFKEEETFDHFDLDKHRKFEKRLIFLISHTYFMIEKYSYQYYKGGSTPKQT